MPALAKPEVLDHIIVGHRNLLQGQHETANLPSKTYGTFGFENEHFLTVFALYLEKKKN